MTLVVLPQGSATTGGGGTGGAGTFTTPPTAGWTWRNQGTTTRQDAADGSALSLIKPANGANAPNVTLYTRPIPASRRVTMAFRFLVAGGLNTSQYPFAGLTLFDSGTLRFTSYHLSFNGLGTTGPGIELTKWDNYTTFNASYLASLQGCFLDIIWLRCTQPAAAGNRVVEWSPDGEVWLPLAIQTVAFNEFITPTDIGLSIDGYGLTGAGTFGSIIKLLSWDET